MTRRTRLAQTMPTIAPLLDSNPKLARRADIAIAAPWLACCLAAALAAAGCTDASCPLPDVDLDGDGTIDERDCAAEDAAAMVATICRLQPELWRTVDACATEVEARYENVPRFQPGQSAVALQADRSAFVVATPHALRVFSPPDWQTTPPVTDWELAAVPAELGPEITDAYMDGRFIAVATDRTLWFDANHDRRPQAGELVDLTPVFGPERRPVVAIRNGRPIVVGTSPSGTIVAWTDRDDDLVVDTAEVIELAPGGLAVGVDSSDAYYFDWARSGPVRWQHQDWVLDDRHREGARISTVCHRLIGPRVCLMAPNALDDLGTSQIVVHGATEARDRVVSLPKWAYQVRGYNSLAAQMRGFDSIGVWYDLNADFVAQDGEVTSVAMRGQILGGAVTTTLGPDGEINAILISDAGASAPPNTVVISARQRRAAQAFLGETCTEADRNCAMGLACVARGSDGAECVHAP